MSPFPAKTSALLAAIVACAALLLSCGGSDDSSPAGSDSVVLPGEEGRPDVEVPAGPAPSKLVVLDLAKGSGRSARGGDELSVRYFSLAYRGHRVYEDHWAEPVPPFILGRGQMVEAWEDGLPGMKKGGRRELVLPGSPETPGNAPEIYVVEVRAIRPPPPGVAALKTTTVKVKGTGPKPKLHYPPKPPKHVVYRVLREGSGPRIRPGDNLAARYVGGSPKTKFVQDFWSEEDPYRFRLGYNQLGKAWVVGMSGMRLGGRREIIVPSRLAYGKGMMVYVIEPLELKKQKPGRQG